MSQRKPAYKVVVVGDAQSGKSSLLFRFQWRKFNQYSKSTVAASFHSKVLSTGHRVNMWDTAGQERFHSMIPMYLKNVDLVLFVYDITRKASFDHLRDYWVNFVEDNATAGHFDEGNWREIHENPTDPTNPIKHTSHIYQGILVGNKTDLVQRDQRQVSTKEGAELAKSLGIPFAETSALDGNNVEKVWSMVKNLLMEIPLEKETLGIELEEESKMRKSFNAMFNVISWCNIL